MANNRLPQRGQHTHKPPLYVTVYASLEISGSFIYRCIIYSHQVKPHRDFLKYTAVHSHLLKCVRMISMISTIVNITPKKNTPVAARNVRITPNGLYIRISAMYLIFHALPVCSWSEWFLSMQSTAIIAKNQCKF